MSSFWLSMGLLFLSTVIHSLSAQTVDFEVSEGFSPDVRPVLPAIINVTDGEITISDTQAASGGQSLELPNGSEVSIQLIPCESGTVFCRFSIKPAIGKSVEDSLIIQVGEFFILFEEQGNMGKLISLKANEKSDELTLLPGLNNLALDRNGSTLNWLELGFRLDLAESEVDFLLNGMILAAGVTMDNPVVEIKLYNLDTTRLTLTYLDELLLTANNPFFPDDDNDGISNDYERLTGSEPLLSNRSSTILSEFVEQWNEDLKLSEKGYSEMQLNPDSGRGARELIERLKPAGWEVFTPMSNRKVRVRN